MWFQVTLISGFKYIKKQSKIYFFHISKNANRTLLENQRKASKRGSWKVAESFWRKKNKKWKYACERYLNLFEENEDKKCQYHHEYHKNLSEEEKPRITKHARNYYTIHRK